MAVTVQRPVKRYGTRSYVSEVALAPDGYDAIRSSEIDADLDTLYNSWNSGLPITDSYITSTMLAPGIVGSRELADGGIQTADIGDAQITDQKIVSVAWAKITGAPAAPTTLPPSGPAGGVLTGSYPNPNGFAPGSVTDATIANVSWSKIVSAPASFPPTGAASGSLTGNYPSPGFAANTVGRTQLIVNHIYGGTATVGVPSNFVLSTAGVWTTYVTLPAISTRGGFVHLTADTNLSVATPIAGAQIAQRWLRDGANVTIKTINVASGTGVFVPLPGIHVIDGNCPAGSHTYTYQVLVTGASTIMAGGTTEGTMQAVEIG